MKKLFYLMALCLALPILTVSCKEDEEEPNSVLWFAGKQFSAESYSSNVDWWILSFDKNGGVGHNGKFTVVPYDESGRVLSSVRSLSGKYQVDMEKQRIYVSYDQGGTSFWTFCDDSNQQKWPNYNPNRVISVPVASSGTLAGLDFYSGNVFKQSKK